MTESKLAIIIDPPNQTIEVAKQRVDQFLESGGGAVLVGGSGEIDTALFEDAVSAIGEIAHGKGGKPFWILPGHIDQIMIKKVLGLSGVFNYREIIGGGGKSFEQVYPKSVRKLVADQLKEKGIDNLATLYILCGDHNASVSKVSGILPLDLENSGSFLTDKILGYKDTKIDCIFFESGSNSPKSIGSDVVSRTRLLTGEFASSPLLFASGGITTPGQVRAYRGWADYVVMGGYFERNGLGNVSEFITALH